MKLSDILYKPSWIVSLVAVVFAQALQLVVFPCSARARKSRSRSQEVPLTAPK